MASNNIDDQGLKELRLVNLLCQQWIKDGKVGNIRINFYKHKITAINVSETQKPDELKNT